MSESGARVGKYAPVSPEDVRFHAGASLAGTATEEKQKQMDNGNTIINTETQNKEQQIMSDAEREVIAQQVADMVPNDIPPWVPESQYRLVIVLYSKETGPIHETSVERMVDAIREKRKADRIEQRRKAFEHDKDVVCDALAAHGITTVTVDLNASGGGSENNWAIVAKMQDLDRELVTSTVSMYKHVLMYQLYETDPLVQTEQTLPEAIEHLCIGMLYEDEQWEDWERYDQFWAHFRFDIVARTIRVYDVTSYGDYDD
jgi:hypothetical protein